jgi:hypothetical protein
MDRLQYLLKKISEGYAEGRCGMDDGMIDRLLELSGMTAEIQERIADPKIVVIMEGGLIQNVIGDRPMKIGIVDYDIEGCEPEQISEIPQGPGNKTQAAYTSVFVAEVLPDDAGELLRICES